MCHPKKACVMLKASQFASLTKRVYESTDSQSVTQLFLNDHSLDGRFIRLDGIKTVHFGNVSYIGLDIDSRLKNAAQQAIERYGVQFSSSRSFLSLPLYEELEASLKQMYGRPAVVTPSTTLGHFSAFPIFMHKEDSVFMDYQAHASLQLAIETVRGNGTHVEKLKHGDMNLLEEKIKATKGKGNIWYVADGIYSMFGDRCDMSALNTLQAKYPNLYLYIDDAHGISWTGRHGTGAIADYIEYPERTLLAISLNKGVGAGGGALICPDEVVETYLRRSGASLVFSGPIQPSALAAGIESIKIHQSPEIIERQQRVQGLIQYFKEKARENGLVLADEGDSPVFLVGVGRVDTGIRICKNLRAAGYYTNIGGFPAVPLNQTGLRVSIHYHLEREDIDNLCRILAEMIPMEMAADNYSMDKLRKVFQKDSV